ncbi:MAG TPA: hypothetical protein VFT37_07740 [Telluria sp.]|nr:hypothetical protein [Telluria sp.]
MTISPKVASLARAALLAVLFIGIAAALKHTPADYIDPELARRIVGVMTAGIVILYANMVPKSLTPLAALQCDPAAEQALRRFTGIVLVLGGIGYALAWMFAPLDSANAIAMALLGAALAVVLVRLGVAASRRAPR